MMRCFSVYKRDTEIKSQHCISYNVIVQGARAQQWREQHKE